MSRTFATISPETRRAAMRRAVADGIQVRQLNTSEIWTASSGRNPEKAYELTVRDGRVVSCSCPAGVHGNPYCKHVAAWDLAHRAQRGEA